MAFDGALLIVRIQELAAVPGSELHHHAGSQAGHHDALKHALYILIDGI